MKILFIHGLESTPETSSTGKAITTAFLNVTVADYKPTTKTYEEILEYLKSIATDVDVVIGISLGGFWALHLAEFVNVNVVLINPAITKAEQRYHIQVDVPTDVLGKMYLNLDDTVVNNQENLQRFGKRFSTVTYKYGGHRASNIEDIIDDMKSSLSLMESFIP